MKKVKVLIVDAAAPSRQLITQMLASDETIEVIGSAGDINDACQKIQRLNPDVLTIDSELPYIDGQSFYERLQTVRALPTIMLSSMTQESADVVLSALELGAFEVLPKPRNINDIAKTNLLQERLKRLVHEAARSPHQRGERRTRARILHFKARREGLPIIAIGAATGGVEALHGITAQLPTITPPMVIAQHIPESYIRRFAERLDSGSPLTIVEAVEGARLHNGYAFVAPANKLLTIKKVNDYFVCHLKEKSTALSQNNAINALFASVAEEAGHEAIGVLLTGAGDDGAAGLLAMRAAGAHTIAQDETSARVYGISKAAMECGAVLMQLPLDEIPQHILDASNRRVRR